MKSLCQACIRNKIPLPQQTTLQYSYEGVKRCNDKIKEFRPLSIKKRREHNTNRLRCARLSNDETAIAQIERIMTREESRNTWGQLGCATKKKQSPPPPLQSYI